MLSLTTAVAMFSLAFAQEQEVCTLESLNALASEIGLNQVSLGLCVEQSGLMDTTEEEGDEEFIQDVVDHACSNENCQAVLEDIHEHLATEELPANCLLPGTDITLHDAWARISAQCGPQKTPSCNYRK